MTRLLAVLATLLAGCAAYRIAPKDDSALRGAHIDPGARVEVTKVNPTPEGPHCFEPLLSVLTLGIIPVYCRDTYEASVTQSAAGQSVSGTYTVAKVRGWAPLLLLPLPGWHFGLGNEPQARIERMVAEGSAAPKDPVPE